MAVYEDCASAPIACALGMQGGGATPLVLTLNGLTPHRLYYLRIDGYQEDFCDFEITT